MGKYTIEYGYRKNRRWPYLVFGSLLLAVTSYLISSSRSIQPHSQATVAQLVSKPTSASPAVPQPKITTPLPWPTYGQAAYGVVEDGVLAQSSEATEPVPIASLAKTITVLAVLKQKPLLPGEQGPVITLTEEDIANYQEYVAKSGSVVQIKVGEQISEYQAIQAMLLPSANNMADTLARWAFGSIENYNTYANNMLKELGILKTTVADASGYSPLTKSTASDMVKIGILYIQNPVLQEIAMQPKATIPFAGQINNYNDAINQDGILGLKIGYTEAANNTFLVADVQGKNKDQISVAAVLGARSLPIAMQDAKTVLKSGNVEHKLLPKNN